jgi:hypothetical protein
VLVIEVSALSIAARDAGSKDHSCGAAYWSGRFTSYDQPNSPLRCTGDSAGSGGASLFSAWGGGGGAGKFSHFIE